MEKERKIKKYWFVLLVKVRIFVNVVFDCDEVGLGGGGQFKIRKGRLLGRRREAGRRGWAIIFPVRSPHFLSVGVVCVQDCCTL